MEIVAGIIVAGVLIGFIYKTYFGEK